MNKHTALLVIDVQNGFINPNSSHIPDRIEELINEVSYEHRIFTRFVNYPGSQYELLLRWKGLQSEPETAIVDQLRQYPTVTIEKQYYTCLTDSFRSYIKEHHINTFHIVGIDTDICVLKSAVDIFENEMKPIVFAECCMSYAGDEIHKSALSILPRFIGQRQIVSDYRTYLKLS